MASAESRQSDAELAICRLVEEVSGLDTRFLGPACLASFESLSFFQSLEFKPRVKKFLVASNLVLTKKQLQAIENRRRNKRKRSEPSFKIVAEFATEGKKRSLERRPLSELYSSLKDDVFEVNGVIYISITELKPKSSLLSRSLQGCCLNKETVTSMLSSNQLQCLVFCGVKIFGKRPYDLLQFDSVLADDHIRCPSYFLRDEGKKRYLKEDDFGKDEKPFGAVVLSKDYHLAGFLNFDRKIPAPVWVGIDSATADTIRSCSEVERELPVGTVGDIYPLIDPHAFLQSKNLIGFRNIDKSTTDNPGELTGTHTEYRNENVPDHSETQQCTVGEDDVNTTDDQESASTRGPSPMENSCRSITTKDGKGTLVVCFPPEKDKERPQDNMASRCPSAEESSFQSIPGAENKGARIVDLPTENDKEKTSSKEGLQVDLGLFRTTTNGKVLKDTSNNNILQDCEMISRVDFPNGCDKERRRRTFPSDPPQKEESHTKEKRRASAAPSLQVEKRKIKLDDLMNKTILGCLDLLQGISRHLDKEYKYGNCQCWKHAAEQFGIEVQEYQNFKCSQVHSPTEVMFEYLETSKPDITIGDLKDKLHNIGRQDVIDVILKCDQADCDDTYVCSLFDNNSDVIGEMAFLLDMQKVGLKNWSKLAAELGISRKVFKTFGTNNSTNPTQTLFELLTIKFPWLTIQELVGHLEDMERHDVANAVRSSKKVSEDSLVKALMDDLHVMDTVCELLNRKHRTNKVLGWRHLGNNLKIDKETLDDLSPPEEDFVSPTEAMINHLSSSKPWLTIGGFILALHAIDRDDVFTVFDGYLPGGCIPELLKSCQMSQESHQQQ